MQLQIVSDCSSKVIDRLEYDIYIQILSYAHLIVGMFSVFFLFIYILFTYIL